MAAISRRQSIRQWSLYPAQRLPEKFERRRNSRYIL